MTGVWKVMVVVRFCFTMEIPESERHLSGSGDSSRENEEGQC